MQWTLNVPEISLVSLRLTPNLMRIFFIIISVRIDFGLKSCNGEDIIEVNTSQDLSAGGGIG